MDLSVVAGDAEAGLLRMRPTRCGGACWLRVEREDGGGGFRLSLSLLGRVGVQGTTQRAGKLGGSLQIFGDPKASADRSAARGREYPLAM